MKLGVLSSITCQKKKKKRKKRTDLIFRIVNFNDKNPLYLLLISTLQFFED